MVIWINGAFGAGKTSVARQIAAMRAGTSLFDPEQIGFMLRRVLPSSKVDDFQDLGLWREFTVKLVVEAARIGPVVVPMTVANPHYLEEISSGFSLNGVAMHHFTLDASTQALRRRLRRRLDWPASKRWALDRVESCTAALADEAFATHVKTERRRVTEIAAEILAVVS